MATCSDLLRTQGAILGIVCGSGQTEIPHVCALASWSMVQVERVTWVPTAMGRKGEAPLGVEKVIGTGKGEGKE